MRPRIVVVDGYALNPGDLAWAPLQDLGELAVFDRMPADEIVRSAASADAVLTNKVPFRAECLAKLPRLRYLGVLATGYDIVDVAEATRLGIVVTNIPAYGHALGCPVHIRSAARTVPSRWAGTPITRAPAVGPPIRTGVTTSRR